ncbi:MAG: hypothetical protein KJ600_04410 [Nanoarchaeota archaeon]|nr:hypothetical protein [Nanoarchaeota archaeon]MBU1103771.1 hypothetical protein [Nanoarchaeota archaeon]
MIAQGREVYEELYKQTQSLTKRVQGVQTVGLPGYSGLLDQLASLDVEVYQFISQELPCIPTDHLSQKAPSQMRVELMSSLGELEQELTELRRRSNIPGEVQ